MAQNAEPKRPVEVTRDKLFGQVWQTPMQRLAEQYGVTGNGLAKICDRLNVPYPPRGYWAKVAAGKNAVKFRLPAPAADTPRTAIIRPTPPTPKVQVELISEIEKKTEVLRPEIVPIAGSAKLSRPHPIIERWLTDRAQRRREARQQRDPWRKELYDPGNFSDMDRRRHRLLDALFKAIEKEKGKVKQNERQALAAVMNGEEIEFQIREKQKQIRRPLTSDEKRWASSGDKGWRQELQPTAKLLITIKTHLPNGLRTEWLETDKVSMETLLPQIVATFVTAGPLLVEKRVQRELAQRERHIAEMKQYEESRQRILDDNRWRRFVELARAHRDVSIALDFLNALKANQFESVQQIAGNHVSDWISWAEERLARSDPISGGVADVFDNVSRTTEWAYRN